MKAVILAGGLGTRLRPFTEIIPKPLLPIGEKAILEIQIEHLRSHGFDEIFLATNYRSDYIENFFGDGSKYGIKLTISRENKPLGTAGPLSLLKNKLLSEPFLVMNGDLLTKCNFTRLYEFGSQIDADLTVSIKEFVTPFRFGNIYYQGNYVTGVEEKPNFITNILAGIYLMKPAIFNYIEYDQPLGMDTLINRMLAGSHPIAKYMLDEYWLDIGIVEDYKEVQEAYKNYFVDKI